MVDDNFSGLEGRHFFYYDKSQNSKRYPFENLKLRLSGKKNESGPHGPHPNPKTNKLQDIFCYFDFCLCRRNVFGSYNQNNLLRRIFECKVIWVYIFLITNNCMKYFCWLVSTIFTCLAETANRADTEQRQDATIFFNQANLILILWGKSGIIKFELKTILVYCVRPNLHTSNVKNHVQSTKY